MKHVVLNLQGSLCCRGPLALSAPNRKSQKPAKSRRGREEGDGAENVINCRKLSQIVVTFHDEFYDD